jgi:deazaflavin-dependent oxidoreductase (nitroreductase family)
MTTVTRSGGKASHTELSIKDRLVLFLEREGNRRLRSLGTWLYRVTGGRFTPRERHVVLLTTRGRKSGKRHTVLLQSFQQGKSMVLVAANSGQSFPPDWFLNLKATPEALIQVGDRVLRMRAEEVPAAEASALWPRILRRSPSYSRYRKATDRSLTLVRLVPAGLG